MPESIEWWCRLPGGHIVSHQAPSDGTWGHRDHVRCVPVKHWIEEADDADE